MKKKAFMSALAAVFVFLPCARAQDEEKIRKLFVDAVQAMGGDAFSRVTDTVSEGNYFAFNREGDSSGLIKFNDWTKLPDKNRSELGNRKKERDVQVFNLEKNEGWILEGQKPTREATPEEMKQFRNSVKHNIDNIFRSRWKDPANKLFYMGPGEGTEVRLEVVKLLDPENDEMLIYFDRASKLPAKIEYKSIDTKRGINLRMVEEFSQWHVVDGVNSPLRVDTYRNGYRASQVFVLKIAYNTNLPDSFFSKPEPPK
jgi:hypothetical protein